MREIEILVRVLDDKKKVLFILKQFHSEGVHMTRDMYYIDPKRPGLIPKNGRLHAAFRLRTKGSKHSMTYKKDLFDKKGRWTHSLEYETQIENINEAKKIIDCLGLQKLVEVNTRKHIFTAQDYEIVFEEVEGLGLFLEVEKIHVRTTDRVPRIRSEMHEFIKSLGIRVGEEATMGKPEMMLRKMNANPR